MLEVTTHSQNPELGQFFKTLNEEWLSKYFESEPIDEHVLSNPDKMIAQGGQIIYAILQNEVVGCVALKHHGNKVFELTKMAVTAKHQAYGIGAALMKHIISAYQQRQGKKLYLESHSSLKPALKLYKKFGFTPKPHPFESEYVRSDFYMEYKD